MKLNISYFFVTFFSSTRVIAAENYTLVTLKNYAHRES